MYMYDCNHLNHIYHHNLYICVFPVQLHRRMEGDAAAGAASQQIA